MPNNFTGVCHVGTSFIKCWYKNGLLNNGPNGYAVLMKSFVWSTEQDSFVSRYVKRYHINGKLHREDGPAIELCGEWFVSEKTNDQNYYLNGNCVAGTIDLEKIKYKEFCKILKIAESL